MVAKVGFVLLALIAWGTLFLLDYYIKQDQAENTIQLHAFVQQSREIAHARNSSRVLVELRLKSDLVYCQENAAKNYSNYVSLIVEVAPSNHGQIILPSEIIYAAATIFSTATAECQQAYDVRLREG